ncbi:MAG: ABC-F family ATP-binding cassette domain-containing protein, partial [Kiritimatiellia bacterium]
MLSVNNLSKLYGPRILLDQVSLHVNRADRIALVGANGSGKSTIFRMIIGAEQPDAGAVVCRPGTVIGYLPQETVAVGQATVLETATSITPEIGRLQEQVRSSGEIAEAARARLDELRLYEIEPRAQTVLAGLGFRQSDFQRPLRTMSGGWIMRAHLARLLVQQPDLLMLDEPTNHLDLASLLWLQDYLKKYPGAILMISHDRAFINGLINQVLEIDRTAIQRYRGNYDDYLLERAARREQQLAAYRNQQREIAALQRFADRFRAKATKAAQAQSRLKRLERMERLAPPETKDAAISFQWPQPTRSGRCVMTLSGIHQSYGALAVYRDLNYQVERGQRTVLVGPNGAGKSTLMRTIATLQTPTEGTIRFGDLDVI